MKKRIRRILSILLAASMVFTVNTAAFAEEAVEVVEADETVESGEEVEAVEDAAAGSEAAEDEAAIDEAAVTAADSGVEDYDGILYKDGKLLTNITYEPDNDKKNPRDSVATITNTTDPVSWNNAYGSTLIYTVVFGDNEEKSYLNNSTGVTASKNGVIKGEPEIVPEAPAGIRYDFNYRYEVIPIKEGEVYLFVAYGLADGSLVNVEGYTEIEKAQGGTESLIGIPVTAWDGRKIVYNSSGKYKYNKVKREELDIGLSLVTYNNGVVKEVNGLKPGSVKVDSKKQEKASVKYENKTVSVDLIAKDPAHPEAEAKKTAFTSIQYPTLGDLPFFTMKALVKKGDAQEYKKVIDEKLKDHKFYFGIRQAPVFIDFDNDDRVYGESITVENILYALSSKNGDRYKDSVGVEQEVSLINDKGEDRSAYSVKEDTDSNGTKKTYTISGDMSVVEEYISRIVTRNSGNQPLGDLFDIDPDVDKVNIGVFDADHSEELNAIPGTYITVHEAGAVFEVTKFDVKKGEAEASIKIRGKVGNRKDGYTVENIKALSGKGKTVDYTLTNAGSLAGADAYVLDFVKDGNYVYSTYNWRPDNYYTYSETHDYPGYADADNGAFIAGRVTYDADAYFPPEGGVYASTEDYVKRTRRLLGALGYKYAFRQTPNSKENTFRAGVFAKENTGFLFEAE